MNKLTRFLVPLLLAVVIIASCGWYLFVYDRDFTRDMLLQQARNNDIAGNASLSSWFYNLAYVHSGQDQNVAIELANQYIADGNYTKAEYTLTNAIHDAPTVELYVALCKTYVEQDKLLDAVTMLDNIQNPEIKAQLEQMRPSVPTADHEPGFYSQYIDVALSSSAGTLYYSAEGEYPSTADAPYSKPYTLPGGETLIYAISVDENGLVSPLSILGYTVGGVIEPAIFMDAAIEASVRELLGAEEGDILFTNELWDITEFTVPEGVASYEDLKLMPYLKKLTIQNQTLDSLSHLSTLAKLETLDLTGCRFPAEDLAVLADLPSLTNLTVASCSLSTIADLADSKSLICVDLSSNTIRNLEALSTIPTLKEIYLQHNAVVSVEQISTLRNLEKLDVSYNSLESLAPIIGCIKLSWLNADGNQLADLEGVSSLNLLTHLSVDYNKLTDISSLAYCTELVNLSVANNEISDISALGSLLNLDILDFSYNTVTALPEWQDGCMLRTIDGSYNKLESIDNLNTLDNISYVYMDYNALTSVDALANCYKLVQVNVFGNEIKDVSALTDHDIIVNYDPTK